MKLTTRAFAARVCLAVAAIAGCVSAPASASTYTFRLSSLGLVPTAAASQPQGPFSFTSCGATGATGPTATQCATAYSGTALSGNTSTSAGIQSWTVPATGNWTVVLAGGGGGGSSYSQGEAVTNGAVLTTTLALTKGSVLQIIVGQAGVWGYVGGAGGGGGTFVVSGGNLLAVAGGGGGAPGGGTGKGINASIDTTPTSTLSGASGTGGGSGFSANGVAGGTGGQSYAFTNGGRGGIVATENGQYGDGGFGGGGGGGTGGGGGGGYAANNGASAGGTTYSSGAVVSSTATNTSVGYATFTLH